MSRPFKALSPAILRTIEVDYFPPLVTVENTDSSSTDSSAPPEMEMLFEVLPEDASS